MGIVTASEASRSSQEIEQLRREVVWEMRLSALLNIHHALSLWSMKRVFLGSESLSKDAVMIDLVTGIARDAAESVLSSIEGFSGHEEAEKAFMLRSGIPPASVLGIDLREEFGIVVDRIGGYSPSTSQGNDGRYLTIGDLERYERDEIADLEKCATTDRAFLLRWITTKGKLLDE